LDVLFSLSELLEDVRVMFADQPEARGLEIRTEIREDVSRLIVGDKGKIRQILVNLAANAVKFTREGHVRILASVVESGGNGCLIAIEVSDTGCGIEKPALATIFNLFAQAEGGRRSGSGTGLGLPLSLRYSRILGGDITVTSEVGKGSCFRFTFRAKHGEGLPGGDGWGDRVLAPDCCPFRILIVDDDASNREMLDVMLRMIGFETETAPDAEGAIRALEQRPSIRMVLMDKCMPRMNGLEAATLIRSRPRLAGLKMLIVSASGFSGQREEALLAGADGHVSKPIQRGVLLEEIARVAGLRFITKAVSELNTELNTELEDDSLIVLSLELRQAFDQALRRGDIRQLRRLASEAVAVHPVLAAKLIRLVATYDYTRLKQLLERSGVSS
jgi:two-component system sensor histidine kinase/response regulator